MLDGILAEHAGIPAVSLITEPFRVTGAEMAKAWGVPDYKFLEMPHPISHLNEEEVAAAAQGILAHVVALLKIGQAPE